MISNRPDADGPEARSGPAMERQTARRRALAQQATPMPPERGLKVRATHRDQFPTRKVVTS